MKSISKRELKKACHALKPVVRVGQKGLSENVMDEINLALDVHELIKVKISQADKLDKQEMVEQIRNHLNAEVIQSIGNMVCFYRCNPEKRVHSI